LIANEPPFKIIGFIIFFRASLFDQGSLGSLTGVGGGSHVFEDKMKQEG